jgi:hypothetical protein
MKKIIAGLLLAVSLFSAVSIAAYADGIGSAAAVLAKDVSLIKTGLVGRSLKFTDTDFKTALGSAEFDKIKIHTLPTAEDGTLMLGEKAVKEGQEIRRKNLGSLVFIPSSAQVRETGFTFEATGIGTGAVHECVIRFIEEINYAPEISAAASSSTFTTQTGISVFGELSASDPESDAIEFIIVSYPKRGTLAMIDKEAGRFKYTPYENATGADEFICVARDEYGNYSGTAEIKLNVIDRMSPVIYEDMKESEGYNAAVALTAMGVMSGKVIGDGVYFMPEETVSRAEFLAMAMRCVGMRCEEGLTETFFDDNDLIPRPLVSYVATAQKKGVVNGAFEKNGLYFRPNDAITRYEAAIIMANLVGARDSTLEVFAGEDVSSIPIWARAELGAMCALGVLDKDEALSAPREALTREAAATYLYALVNSR